MRRELYCEVIGEPVPQGSMRALTNKSGRAYMIHSNKDLKPWRDKIVDELKMECWGQEPLDGAIEAHFAFVLPRGKTVKRDRPYAKPDLDKLVRAALDAITASGAIGDDAQVCVLHASKYYVFPGQEAKLKLHLKEMF